MTSPTISSHTSRWFGRRFLFSIGKIKIPSYVAMLYIGSVVGIVAGGATAASLGIDPILYVSVAVVLLIPGLIGARLLFVFQHLRFFHDEPQRIWQRHEGGLASDGGFVASVAASVPILMVAKIPFWPFWDATSVTMLIGVIVGRFGCMMHGCCAGRSTNGPFGIWLPNHRDEWRRRFPAPLFEAAWAAIVLLILLFLARTYQPVSGAMFLAAVISYAAGRALIALTRESDNRKLYLVFNLVTSAVFIAAATTLLFYRWPA